MTAKHKWLRDLFIIRPPSPSHRRRKAQKKPTAYCRRCLTPVLDRLQGMGPGTSTRETSWRAVDASPAINKQNGGRIEYRPRTALYHLTVCKSGQPPEIQHRARVELDVIRDDRRMRHANKASRQSSKTRPVAAHPVSAFEHGVSLAEGFDTHRTGTEQGDWQRMAEPQLPPLIRTTLDYCPVPTLPTSLHSFVAPTADTTATSSMTYDGYTASSSWTGPSPSNLQYIAPYHLPETAWYDLASAGGGYYHGMPNQGGDVLAKPFGEYVPLAQSSMWSANGQDVFGSHGSYQPIHTEYSARPPLAAHPCYGGLNVGSAVGHLQSTAAGSDALWHVGSNWAFSTSHYASARPA